MPMLRVDRVAGGQLVVLPTAGSGLRLFYGRTGYHRDSDLPCMLGTHQCMLGTPLPVLT